MFSGCSAYPLFIWRYDTISELLMINEQIRDNIRPIGERRTRGIMSAREAMRAEEQSLIW